MTSPNNYQPPRQDIDFTIALLGVVVIILVILTR